MVSEPKMIESKRSSFSVEHGSIVSLATKRHKTNISIYPKDGKENLGEQISALQQLVSPYGKTDTASVLLGAIEYIQFLHEQIKVLSAPYLQSAPAVVMQELEHYSLRRRGLCLVPFSCTTADVVRSNGADLWTPIKTTSARFQ